MRIGKYQIHYVCTCYQYWNGADSWRSPSFKKWVTLSCIIKTDADDGLVTQGTKASTSMVLTLFSQNTLVSAPEGLGWCWLYSSLPHKTGDRLCLAESFPWYGHINVRSPYDLNNYASDSQVCLVHILAPPDSVIRITFRAFDVDCKYYAMEVMLFFFQWDIGFRSDTSINGP